MPLPGVLPGGDPKAVAADANKSAMAASAGGLPAGVFGHMVGATPKYALNQGQRDAEYRETMARLFIQVPEEEREQFVSSCPPETQPLARVLCGGAGTGFVDFLLTQVSEGFQEKIQVVESLSDNFIVYSFGQRAPQFNYAGVLLNTYQDDQRVWMMRLYQDVLRATQLARRRKLVRLRYDSVIVSGVLTNHSQSLTADMQMKADFQFGIIATQYVIISPTVAAPTRLETAFTEGAQFGLGTAQPTDTMQLRVVAAKQATYPSGEPAAGAKPGPNDPNQAQQGQSNPAQKLAAQAKAPTNPSTTAAPMVRGGA